MKELSHFISAARRDVLADAIGARGDTIGRDTLMKLVQYGNAFLQAERRKPENDGEVLWFSISFGDPVHIGLTWALNPEAPRDDFFEADFFWRLWSEIDQEVGGSILSAEQAQEELARYVRQQSH